MKIGSAEQQKTTLEPLPLTPGEFASYVGVERALVEEWVKTNHIETVSFNGSLRIPFSAYERRATGKRNLALMKRRRET